MVFAVATTNSVLIYNTDSLKPFFGMGNFHYAALTDISWKDDDYSKKISELDTYDTCTTTNEKFVDTLGEKIETDKINTIT